MRKEWFGVVALMMVASIVIAGCTSLTNSNQVASPTPATASMTATTTTKASVSATPKPTPSPSVVRAAKPAVLATPTPSLHPVSTAIVPSWRPPPSPTPKVGGSANLKVLFFYKPECPYCQAMEPQVTQLQNTYAGKISVQWIVSATSPMTAQYGVTTVPTLILLNSGNEVGRWVAASDTSGISAQVNSLSA